MNIEIKNYSCGLDASLFGIEGEGEIEYEVTWDTLVSNPKDPQLWRAMKKALLAELNFEIQEGHIPFVAVFIPKKLNPRPTGGYEEGER